MDLVGKMVYALLLFNIWPQSQSLHMIRRDFLYQSEQCSSLFRFITVLLTALFLWPLLRRRLINVELRSLARRTFVTSAVALSASIVSPSIQPGALLTTFTVQPSNHLLAQQHRTHVGVHGELQS